MKMNDQITIPKGHFDVVFVFRLRPGFMRLFETTRKNILATKGHRLPICFGAVFAGAVREDLWRFRFTNLSAFYTSANDIVSRLCAIRSDMIRFLQSIKFAIVSGEVFAETEDWTIPVLEL